MALLAPVSEESEEPLENWARFKQIIYITTINKLKHFDLKNCHDGYCVNDIVGWHTFTNYIADIKLL